MNLRFYHKSDDKIRSTIRFRDALRLMNFPEFPFVRVILINTLAMSLLGLAIPLSIQMVINAIIRTAMRQPLIILSLVMLFVLSFSGLLQVIQTYTVEILRRRLFVRFGLVISERMTHYKDEVFRRENSPALINRYFDTIIMQSSMVTFFVDGFGFLVMFLVGFGLLTFYHPYFLAFSVAMAVFLLVNWLLFGPAGVRAGSPEADGKYNLVSWIEELSRVRNMFASEHGRSFSNQKITDLFNQWLEKRNTLFACQFRQHIGLQIFSVLTNVILLFLGGLLVLNRELSVGQLVAAALVVGNIISSIPRLQNFFIAVYDYSTSLDKIAEFYDYPLEKAAKSPVALTSYEVEFKDIVVQPNYNFKFAIPESKRIFVFVKSFSSIDVMYDLMMDFITPAKGDVFVGGKHHEDIDIPRFRNDVQLVRHDQFFAGTIHENLLDLNGNKAEMAAIHETLEKVGLWNAVQRLPDKLDTPIRPNGFPFTRSQLLTLQIARAMLNQPKILLVTPDFEQISHETRRRVFKALLDPAHGWTILFFSQKVHDTDFDMYTYLDRNGMHTVTDMNDLVV